MIHKVCRRELLHKTLSPASSSTSSTLSLHCCVVLQKGCLFPFTSFLSNVPCPSPYQGFWWPSVTKRRRRRAKSKNDNVECHQSDGWGGVISNCNFQGLFMSSLEQMNMSYNLFLEKLKVFKGFTTYSWWLGLSSFLEFNSTTLKTGIIHLAVIRGE